MWKNYFFTVDFTDVASVLGDFQVGVQLTERQEASLVTLLREKDPRPSGRDKWYAGREPSAYNVRGVEVVYHGENLRTFKTNAKYNRVLILSLADYPGAPERRDIHLCYNGEV